MEQIICAVSVYDKDSVGSISGASHVEKTLQFQKNRKSVPAQEICRPVHLKCICSSVVDVPGESVRENLLFSPPKSICCMHAEYAVHSLIVTWDSCIWGAEMRTRQHFLKVCVLRKFWTVVLEA